MSNLRYAKSGHRERTREHPKPSHRKSGGRSNVRGLLAVAILVASGVGAAKTLDSSDTAPAPVAAEATNGADVDALIAKAEALHQASHGEPAAEAPKAPAAAKAVRVADASAVAQKPVEPAARAEKTAPAAKAEPMVAKLSRNDRIRRGETLSRALNRQGVPMSEVNALVVSLKGTLDMRSIRPGDAYKVEKEGDADGANFRMDVFEFRPSGRTGAPTTIVARRTDDGYEVKKEVTPVQTKVVALKGSVSSSLYTSMKAQGEGNGLVDRFADVFAWNIDFYRETQKGDTYKVIVEKKYAEGRFIGYGKVLAAEYVNAGHVNRGFNFNSKDGNVQGIFDDSGDSLERTFLKSPLEVTRVTSRYGQRFHPVLKRMKAHRGIDYGASRGTPFWTVADGVVQEARYSRTAGNMVVIRHAQGYTTEYFHASAFAKGLKPGMKVKQRQVIGYVGSTGRSTGPHLHFGMKKKGGHVDPVKQKFPAAKPVPSNYLEEFTQAIASFRAELEALELS